MYATIRRYRLASGALCDRVMEHLQRDVASAVADLPGLRSFQAIDIGDGVILAVVTFDGREEAIAAAGALEDAIDRILATSLDGKPDVSGGIVAAFVTREQGRPAEAASGQPIDGSDEGEQ